MDLPDVAGATGSVSGEVQVRPYGNVKMASRQRPWPIGLRLII